METILAITLSDRRVTCLKLEAHAKTSVVADYFYASYGNDDDLKTILLPVLKRFGRCDSCRVSLDASYFYFRNISLPFSDIKKIEKVLVHELEDSTSYSCADMHYDFLSSPNPDGTAEIIVALIEKQVVAELIAFFSECGIDPDLITITELAVLDELIRREGQDQSLMLVDAGAEQLSLTVVKRGKLHLVRSIVLPGEQGGNGHNWTNRVFSSIRQVLLSTGGTADQDISQRIFLKGSASYITELEQSLTEQFGMNTSIYLSAQRQLLKIEPTDNLSWDPQIMDDALCLAYKGKGDAHTLNLRKAEFRKQKNFKDLKKLFLVGGIMAILSALVLGVYGGYELNRLKNKQNELKTEIEAVFKETLPEVSRIVRPVEQLRVKVDEVKELYSVSRRGSDTMGMVSLLAEISSRIPPDLQINLTRFVADGDSVRLRGETQDFKTVDSVQKSLEKSPAFKTVIISSANLATTGEGVRFEIKLDLNE